MRSRDRILANLEATYRESYDKASSEEAVKRMQELDWAYQRDQLMMEVLLDIRDMLAQAPAGPGTLEKLEALRKMAKLR